jgi:hypothetical protein
MQQENEKKISRISILNQGGGGFFRDFVFKVAEKSEGVTYYCPDKIETKGAFKLKKAPKYNRKNILLRLISWCLYLIVVGFKILIQREKSLLLIVSNPPLAPIIGLIMYKLKKYKYVLLFYDIYPDALIKFAGLSEKSIVVKYGIY